MFQSDNCRKTLNVDVQENVHLHVLTYFNLRYMRKGKTRSAAHPGRTLHPNKTRYPFYRRHGGSQGRSGWAENLVPTWIRSRIVQPIVSRYTDWVTHIYIYIYIYKISWDKTSNGSRIVLRGVTKCGTKMTKLIFVYFFFFFSNFAMSPKSLIERNL